MTRVLVLALAVSALLASGCGDDRPSGAEIFEEFSTQDSETLLRVIEPMDAAADELNRLSAHVQREDLPAAERSVARLDRLLAEAETEAEALNGMDVRSTIGDYVRTTRRAVEAYDRALVAVADPNISDQALNSAARDVREAMRAALRADRAIVPYLAEAMPAAQGDAFRAEMRKERRELEERMAP